MVASITGNALVTVIQAVDRGLISAASLDFVACSTKCERPQASLSAGQGWFIKFLGILATSFARKQEKTTVKSLGCLHGGSVKTMIWLGACYVH